MCRIFCNQTDACDAWTDDVLQTAGAPPLSRCVLCFIAWQWPVRRRLEMLSAAAGSFELSSVLPSGLFSLPLISYPCLSTSLCSPFNLVFLFFFLHGAHLCLSWHVSGADFVLTCVAGLRDFCVDVCIFTILKKVKMRWARHVYKILKSIDLCPVFILLNTWFWMMLEVILPSWIKGCLEKHRQLIWLFRVQCQH